MNEIPALLMEEHGSRRAADSRRSWNISPNRRPRRRDRRQLLSAAYDQLHLKGVHDFHAAWKRIAGVVAERIELALARRSSDQVWRERLRGVTHERLVRECRDRIVAGDLKRAARGVLTLFARARDEAEIDDFASFLARGMVELTHDHERALSVIGYAMKAGGEPGRAAALLADRFNHLAKEFKTVQFSRAIRPGSAN